VQSARRRGSRSQLEYRSGRETCGLALGLLAAPDRQPVTDLEVEEILRERRQNL